MPMPQGATIGSYIDSHQRHQRFKRELKVRHFAVARLSVNKGKAFERKIAIAFREVFPEADVHRSSQADRARDSDIVIEGDLPWFVKRLWIEAEDSEKPSPESKMTQAARDVGSRERDPVVIWHRKHERAIWVTCRLELLLRLSVALPMRDQEDPLVTLELVDFLTLLHGRCAWEPAPIPFG